MLKVLMALIGLYLFNGCSQLATNKTMNKHVDESKELQHLMHSLNMSVYEKNRTELELDDIKRRYATNIVANIEKVTVVLERSGKKSFEGDSLKKFLSLSDKLGSHAKKIQLLADNYEMQELDIEIEKMKLTCKSCHKQFRSKL